MLSALLLLLPASLLATDDPAPALLGLDPVLLCQGKETPGSEEWVTRHGRYDYRFASEETLTSFRADPDRWCIQWGGGCGRMGPLSGRGSADRWTVHNGRIFIFASDGCRDAFVNAPERYVVPVADPQPFSQEAREAGITWLERALEAHGGEENIDRPQVVSLLFSAPAMGWTQHVTHVIARSGDFARRLKWTPPDPESKGNETLWVVGEESFVDEREGRFSVTSPEQISDLRRIALREPVVLLWARGEEGFEAGYEGPGRLAGQAVENLSVRYAGLSTTLHLDPGSGQVLGISWRGRPTEGITRDVVETFTDWTTVDGVLSPVARIVRVDGQQKDSLALNWNHVHFHAEVPAEAFEVATR